MHLRFAWSTLLCCIWACDAANSDRLGQTCQADDECPALICAADLSDEPADLEAMPLHCAAHSSQHDPGEACQRADDCEHGLCLLAGACARSCRDDQDCGATQRCQPVYTRVNDSSLAGVNACVDVINLPRGSRVDRRELTAALSGGLDQLNLPAFAPQTLYVVEHLSDMSWPVPSSQSRCRPPLCAVELRDDAGEKLFVREQLSTEPEGPQNPIAQGSHVSPLTVWIPNGADVGSEARSYELQVESKKRGDVRITSVSRDEPGLRLDLNLFYVGAATLKPEGTRGPPLLEAALEELERIFEPADIFIGEVRQLSVPGGLAERGSDAARGEVSAGFKRLISQYQVLPELPELLKLSAGAANTALDVFFVSDIETTTGADIGGITAGTPVAFGMHGGPGSGLVIATDMFVLDGRASELGRTLAHEVGHALGLFHTVEPNGVVFDPLPDTPACPLTQDKDDNASLDAKECAAYGGDNLMFPTTDAGDKLSEGQHAVLRRALLLQ
ncbi:MAG TPA: hypothetical protein VFN67_39045 [Polyangiales bacterium]|nr:hypothetical protein [Polyangiales bacterium]